MESLDVASSKKRVSDDLLSARMASLADSDGQLEEDLVRDLSDERDLNRRLVALLASLEWSASTGWDGEYCACPACKNIGPTEGEPEGPFTGHSLDCPLATLLAEARAHIGAAVQPPVTKFTVVETVQNFSGNFCMTVTLSDGRSFTTEHMELRCGMEVSVASDGRLEYAAEHGFRA